MTRLAVFIATVGYCGYFPFAPGTVGSAAGLLFYALVWWSGSPVVEIGMILGLFAAGVWAGTTAERYFGGVDPGPIVMDEVVGIYFGENWVSVDPAVDYDATLAAIQTTVDGYPGIFRDVQTYLQERIKEVLTGAGASIVVRLYGPDLAVLRAKAKEVEKAMAEVPGVANLKVEAQVLVPQVEVRLRPRSAARHGLTAGQVRRAVTTLVRGTKVGEVYEGALMSLGT